MREGEHACPADVGLPRPRYMVRVLGPDVIDTWTLWRCADHIPERLDFEVDQPKVRREPFD